MTHRLVYGYQATVIIRHTDELHIIRPRCSIQFMRFFIQFDFQRFLLLKPRLSPIHDQISSGSGYVGIKEQMFLSISFTFLFEILQCLIQHCSTPFLDPPIIHIPSASGVHFQKACSQAHISQLLSGFALVNDQLQLVSQNFNPLVWNGDGP